MKFSIIIRSFEIVNFDSTFNKIKIIIPNVKKIGLKLLIM